MIWGNCGWTYPDNFLKTDQFVWPVEHPQYIAQIHINMHINIQWQKLCQSPLEAALCCYRNPVWGHCNPPDTETRFHDQAAAILSRVIAIGVLQCSIFTSSRLWGVTTKDDDKKEKSRDKIGVSTTEQWGCLVWMSYQTVEATTKEIATTLTK